LPRWVLRGFRVEQVQPHKAAIPEAESEERQRNATDDDISTSGPDGPGATSSRAQGEPRGSECEPNAG
jgi:hypothetical protein